jgi:hypothetical protein
MQGKLTRLLPAIKNFVRMNSSFKMEELLYGVTLRIVFWAE